ncbi:23S ribosomal RNA methyltransferase Erm [Bowdeniella nasicola]|uniref:23S ribosomal RNA methyltransferase Erm n=1 Tax=Bowdeniella nasicola TaxID=208480 RepID=A0A1Q5PZR3_9ACTO|nr:23S ribosomal RNA methyltransferase Erm [Bowdeniella nasicola]OKL53121.1 23S ribosomal RNA methyltransferase Erm [Bowdeniella nasicola]
MPTYRHGRHEHGQNFLTDKRTLDTVVAVINATSGPIIEIGPGGGALTVPLAHLGRPITAVEIDSHLAKRLASWAPRNVTVVEADFLAYRLPSIPHVLVGNLPFHMTTAIMRRILHAPGWTDAVLLVQWEAARRRAGVGGSTMMTAQWAPWFEFELHGRVPARAFIPQPGVDGGLLLIHRRAEPLLSPRQRRQFQALVHRVYTGPGHGLARILARNTQLGSLKETTSWLACQGLSPSALPKHLNTSAWVDLFETTRSSPPKRARRRS